MSATATPGTSLTVSLARTLWSRLDIGAPEDQSGELIDTMVATLMKPSRDGVPASDAQVQAFLMVASAHRLNPWLKEIHAFVDTRNGGIVPVVGIDGWINIIQSHPQFDGMEFDYADVDGEKACTCTIWRKDRQRPTKVTEFMSECKGTSPAWAKTPRRMLRHRATMQAGRVAFGIGGIRAPDEVDGYQEPGGGPAQSIDPSTGFETELMPTSAKAKAAPAAARPPADIIDVAARTVHQPEPTQPRPGTLADMGPAWDDEPPAAASTAPPAPTAAAPRTAAATTPKANTDRPATDGEKANLANKAMAAKLDLGQVLAERGFSLATLTAGQFDDVKAWFAGRS